MLAPLAPDVAWTEMEGFPLAGTYIGPDAIRTGVFERLGREWLDYSATLDSLYDAGNTIVATGWYAGTYPPTGNPCAAGSPTSGTSPTVPSSPSSSSPTPDSWPTP